MFVLSQIFVIISGVLFACSYFFKKKELILIINFFNNIFFATHFLLLKSFTASYSVFLIAILLVSIYYIEKYNKEKYSHILLIISLITLSIISIFTWEGFVSLLPISAGILTLHGTILKQPLKVKFFYLFSTILNTIFMFIIGSYFGFGINLGILTVGIIGIINHIRSKKV